MKPLAANAFRAALRSFGKQGMAVAEANAAADAAAETAIRAALKKAGKPDDVIEQVVQAMRQGGHMPTAPPPDVPVRVRPGETVVQKSAREFEVHGTRATPPVPTTPTLLEMQGFGTTPVSARPEDAAARNAYNYMQGLGAPDALATDAARRGAGAITNQQNFDPRQALLLALLLGQGQRQ